MKDQYIVQPRKPLHIILIVLITCAVCTLLFYIFLNFQIGETHNKLEVFTQKNTQLDTALNQLQAQNKELSEQNEILTQEINLLKVTNNSLQSNLQTLQTELMTLNKELIFYENITQGNTSTKLQVRELLLKSDPKNPAQYFYRIVITQGKKINKPLTGKLLLTIHFNNEKIKPKLISEHDFNLKNVQVIEGMLKGVDKDQVKNLSVTLKDKNKTLTSRTFNWEVKAQF